MTLKDLNPQLHSQKQSNRGIVGWYAGFSGMNPRPGMSSPTGGRNSIAHTPALPTTRVAHKSHIKSYARRQYHHPTGTANAMCDDTKQYTYSSHTPALPTPCMRPAISWPSHPTGTANAMCGKPSNQGMVLT
ncbi:unnamed protein product [Prunus armeniaca]